MKQGYMVISKYGNGWCFFAISAELEVRGRLKPIVTLRKEVQKRKEKLGTRYLKTVFSRQVRRDVRFYGNKA